MDHVTTYVPDAVVVPWLVLVALALVTAGAFALSLRYVSMKWRSGAFFTLTVVGIVGLGVGAVSNIFGIVDHKAALNPATDDVADAFGLTSIPSDDSSYGDKYGHVYAGCYATSTKIDAHHVSSKLWCSNNGSHAVAVRKVP